LRDRRFAGFKELREKSEREKGITRNDSEMSDYSYVADKVSRIASKIMEIQVKSKSGYYKLVDQDKLMGLPVQ
jgi:hypothetical protein